MNFLQSREMVAFEPSHDSNPPLFQHYTKLVTQCKQESHDSMRSGLGLSQKEGKEEEFDELPLIDLNALASTNKDERDECTSKIVSASSEWGFFQVMNHGVSPELLTLMRAEQVKLFETSFSWKSESGILDNSYRWGALTAISTDQFSWSEAFHMPLDRVSDPNCYGEFSSLRQPVMEYTQTMQRLAKLLAEVLITNLGQKVEAFEKKICCDEKTCFLRLNHYPKCPLRPHEKVHGLVPHTDSDFLTILHQDQVGGLQLIKDSKWVAVKPVQDALIVNIGDLFQAWSNDLYKSVEHRVMGNAKRDRYTVAYFLCPTYDSIIGSCKHPSVYKRFSFGEYRSKVQEDSRLFGHKVGLSRFLL